MNKDNRNINLAFEAHRIPRDETALDREKRAEMEQLEKKMILDVQEFWKEHDFVLEKKKPWHAKFSYGLQTAAERRHDGSSTPHESNFPDKKRAAASGSLTTDKNNDLEITSYIELSQHSANSYRSSILSRSVKALDIDVPDVHVRFAVLPILSAMPFYEARGTSARIDFPLYDPDWRTKASRWMAVTEEYLIYVIRNDRDSMDDFDI